MSELESNLGAGRERLREIQREAGFDPHDDEPGDPEALERYVEALESEVVGQVAAMKTVAQSMRRP